MLYTNLILSKNNLLVPVFSDGKTMHSKYDPQKEALNFGNEANSKNKFTIIIGLGAGYHIESFAKRNPDNLIVAVENSIQDISFVSKIDSVKSILENTNIIVTDVKKLEEKILQNFIPALHGGINILSNRAWVEHNENAFININLIIKNSIEKTSRDFSVQSHFGFIWQKNILDNLKLCSKLPEKKFSFDTNKTACIIAAGPSLDYKINELKTNRDKYFIIATDTAFSVLTKYKIKSDAVVSIDGQNISYSHFIGIKNPDTVFVLDLESNSNCAKNIYNFSKNIIFTSSGHPLSNFAVRTSGKNFFPKLESGSGTVTIAAVDFARKAGFTKIKVYGADFSYTFSKPYTKGTYLDFLYRKNESRILLSENSFVNLMFRTETKKIKSVSEKYKYVVASDVLDSYRASFIEWLSNNDFSFSYNDYVYECSRAEKTVKEMLYCSFDFCAFIEQVKTGFFNHEKCCVKISDLSPLETALLPYIAFLRKTKPEINSFNAYLKLAFDKILEYT